MDNGNTILIVAASGRLLAASARRGGYVPLVADFFADEDTVALAPACIRLHHALARGIDGEELLDALQTVASNHEPHGIICGTGFEDRPHLLARMAERWTLYGNGADVVARVKDPAALASLCAEQGIPHPQTSIRCPADAAGWLRKRRGGAGGRHISSASEPAANGPEIYFQRRVAGRPVSILFLADGRRAIMLGFSAQWCSPTASEPFRYGGAVRPADITRDVCDRLSNAVRKLVPAAGIVGLNSADFLIDRDDLWLLEINPRPGATLDIFEPPGTSLVALHIAACEGKLIDPPGLAGAAASAIVYAEDAIPSFPAIAWPAWAADRSHPGATIGAGEPLCTVHACAPSASEARRLVELRTAAIVAAIHASAE